MARNIFGDPKTQSQIDGPSLATEDDDSQPKVSWLGRLVRNFTHAQVPDAERARELRRAVRGQDHAAAEKLLAGGVGVYEDQEASLGCIATRRSDQEMLDLLIRAGVDINQADRRSRDHKSRTPLMEAARKGWEDGIKLLLDAKANTEVADETGATALSLAVRGGKIAAVRQLLSAGANPNGTGGPDQHQMVPLHEAANEEMVDALLSAGAFVNARDRQGFTALHYHARAGRVGIMRRLLAAKADVDALDKNNRSPLFMIGQRGDCLGALNAMIEGGANLDLIDREQNTFIHLVCARAEDPRVFELLVSVRPLMFARQNQVGETPRDILNVRGYREMATRLTMTEDERRRKGDFVAPERRSLMGAARNLNQPPPEPEKK
jgi:ankyrin repeat protein